MLDQSYYRKTDEIIEHYGRKAGSLIPIMQDIQAEYRYLPGELLRTLAGYLSAADRFAEFSMGIFDLSTVVYYLGISAFFLFAVTLVSEGRRQA